MKEFVLAVLDIVSAVNLFMSIFFITSLLWLHHQTSRWEAKILAGLTLLVFILTKGTWFYLK